MPNATINNLVFARACEPTKCNIIGYRAFNTEPGPEGVHVNGDHAHQDYEPGKLPSDYMTDRGTFTPLGVKVVEVHASFFEGKTKPKSYKPAVAPLKNDRLDARTSLKYASHTNFELNLATGEWIKPEVCVPPRENDLLCGVMSKDKHGNAAFEKWWICSEQFFKLILVLRSIGVNSPLTVPERIQELTENQFFASLLKEYDPNLEQQRASGSDASAPDTTSASKLLVLEDFYRFSKRANNFTLGSAVNKEIWARLDSNAPPLTYKELSDRYFRSRCERYTRDPTCVHLYIGILSKLIYNEELTDDNVPKNILGYQTLKWRVPANFNEIVQWISA